MFKSKSLILGLVAAGLFLLAVAGGCDRDRNRNRNADHKSGSTPRETTTPPEQTTPRDNMGSTGGGAEGATGLHSSEAGRPGTSGDNMTDEEGSDMNSGRSASTQPSASDRGGAEREK